MESSGSELQLTGLRSSPAAAMDRLPTSDTQSLCEEQNSRSNDGPWQLLLFVSRTKNVAVHYRKTYFNQPLPRRTCDACGSRGTQQPYQTQLLRRGWLVLSRTVPGIHSRLSLGQETCAFNPSARYSCEMSQLGSVNSGIMELFPICQWDLDFAGCLKSSFLGINLELFIFFHFVSWQRVP